LETLVKKITKMMVDCEILDDKKIQDKENSRLSISYNEGGDKEEISSWSNVLNEMDNDVLEKPKFELP
jgi:hypothetical protein